MGLVAHYKLDGNANDSLGSNHGTETSAVYGNGKVTVNGRTGGYVTIPNNEKLQLVGDMSIAFWFFPVSSTLRSTIIDKAYGGEYTINYETSGYLNFYHGSSGANAAAYESVASSVLTQNVWNHCVLTYDAATKTVRWYINGALDKTVVKALDPIPSTNNVRIGIGYTGNPVDGTINDVRFYNHRMSTKEVREIAQGKLVHYKFDTLAETTINQYTDGDYASGTLHPVRSLDAASGVIADPTGKFKGNVFRFMPRASNQYHGKDITVTIGDIYSASVWCFVSADYDGTNVQMYNEQGYAHASPYDLTKKGTWQHLTIENYAATTTNARILLYILSAFTTGHVLFSELQFEEKTHCTPFTPTSRTVTLRDCSGMGFDSVLGHIACPQWLDDSVVGRGSYYFPGGDTVDKYIETDNPLPKFSALTVSLWMKPTDSTGRCLIRGASSSIILHSCGAGFYIYADDATASGYLDGFDVADGVVVGAWNHLVATWDGTTMATYVNGVQTGTLAFSGGANGLSKSDNLRIGAYFNTSQVGFLGSIDDVRVYATCLGTEDINVLFKTRGSIDSLGCFSSHCIEETKHVPLIIDYTSWTIGSSGSQVGFTQNGDGNSIVERPDPFDKNTAVWQTINNDVDSNADGGWNTTSFPVDPTKLYRFTTWVRRDVLGNGSFYFGCYGYGSVNGVKRLTDDVTLYTNPYFIARGWGTFPLYEWILVVGHVFPHDHVGTTNHPDSGFYDKFGNKIANISVDYKWLPETTSGRHRSYLYYSTDPTTHQLWCYPRVDVCDDSQPTLADLLSGVDSRNQDFINDIDTTIPKPLSIVKTKARISSIYELGPTRGMVGYWPLTNNGKDLSLSGNHGTVTGTVRTAGVRQSSLYFNGSSDRILMPDDGLGDDFTEFTVSCWFKGALNASEYSYILHRGISASIGGSVYWIGADLNGYICGAVNGLYVNGKTSYLQDPDTWYHVVLTWDGATAKVYVNGTLDISYSTGITNTIIGSILGFGNSNTISTTRWYDGLLQNVRTYNVALDAQEIEIMYNITSPLTQQQMSQTKNNKVFIKNFIKEN